MKKKHYLVTGSTGTLGHLLVASMTQKASLHDELVISTPGREQLNCGMMALTGYVLEQAKRHGPLSGIVHLAGSEVVMPLRLTKDDAYEMGMFAADTAFALLRAAGQRDVMFMGSSIVLMSSVAAQRGAIGMAAYSAGKAAIEAMARCAAVELAPKGIRVNCVAAGAFNGKMHDRIVRHQTGDARAAYEAKHPLGVGDPQWVVKAILHLLGDESMWTTGSVMTVDGGFTA